MYFTTYLSIYLPMYQWTDPAQQRAKRTPRGQNIFTKTFVDITHTHTSNTLAFGGTGPLQEEFHFQCGLHANYMRILCYHRNHRKVPFQLKIFAKNFLHLNKRKPKNLLKFRRNWRLFIFAHFPRQPLIRTRQNTNVKIKIMQLVGGFLPFMPCGCLARL